MIEQPEDVSFRKLGRLGDDAVVGIGNDGAFVSRAGGLWERLEIADRDLYRYVELPVGGLVIVTVTNETARGWRPEYSGIVLGARGEVVGRLPFPGVVYDAARIDDQVALLGGQGVSYLEPGPSLKAGPSSRGRETQLLAGDRDGLIFCRKKAGYPSLEKTATAGCRSTAGWSFDGDWWGLKPIRCGGWLVESVEGKQDLRARVKLRNLASGKEEVSKKLGGGLLVCLRDGEVWDTVTRKVYALPSLLPAGTANCGGGASETVVAMGDRTLCLDSGGKVRNLVRSR